MAYHVFHQGGHSKSTIIVEAKNELEARGKLQREWPNPIKYRGELPDVMEELDTIECDDLLKL